MKTLASCVAVCAATCLVTDPQGWIESAIWERSVDRCRENIRPEVKSLRNRSLA